MNYKIVPISFEEFDAFELTCDVKDISFFGETKWPDRIYVEPGAGFTVLTLLLKNEYRLDDYGCMYIEIPEKTIVHGIRKVKIS